MTRDEATSFDKQLRKRFSTFPPISSLEVLRGRSSPYIHIRMYCDSLAVPFRHRLFTHISRSPSMNQSVFQLAEKKIVEWEKRLLSYESGQRVNLVQIKAFCDRILDEVVPKYTSIVVDGQLRIGEWAKVSFDRDLGIIEAHVYFPEPGEEMPFLIEDRDFVEVWSSENTMADLIKLTERLAQIYDRHEFESYEVLDEDEEEEEDEE